MYCTAVHDIQDAAERIAAEHTHMHIIIIRLQTVHSASPRTLAADKSVYALWPLATGLPNDRLS